MPANLRQVELVDAPNKPVTEEVTQDTIKSQEIQAKFKIEIIFGKDRSMSNLKCSTGAMVLWYSGRKMHGGGDDRMFWCPYKDCDKPLVSEAFSLYSVVCPTFHRECFTDAQSKQAHIRQLRREGKDSRPLEQMPIVNPIKMFKMTPPNIAKFIEKVWRDLGCNADIYLKYHPSDIRYDYLHESEKVIPDHLDNVRRVSVPMIYPLKNIIKDTSAGAEPWKRFLAMITA